MNRQVAALRTCTAAIYRTKEVPHTLPIFSRSRVIVDHHMSICQTGRPLACAQCASRTAVLACAHGASVRRTAVLACAQCASRTEAPSNGLRKYHRRERHDDPQSRGLLKFNSRYIYIFFFQHFISPPLNSHLTPSHDIKPLAIMIII